MKIDFQEVSNNLLVHINVDSKFMIYRHFQKNIIFVQMTQKWKFPSKIKNIFLCYQYTFSILPIFEKVKVGFR